jgi:hypothetical protein
VSEIRAFLADLSDAYNALYWFDDFVRYRGFYAPGLRFPISCHLRVEQIVPEEQLQLNSVVIRSPGFWEFLGTLNPVQQLRLYLNDRHERRKDKEYREPADRERLQLENLALWQRIFHDQLATIREFAGPEAAERALRHELGPSLARLGRHQDSGLIEGTETLEEKTEPHT